MSTQSIAVETMVVAELQDLFADESVLEGMLNNCVFRRAASANRKRFLAG